jgi:PsbN protein
VFVSIIRRKEKINFTKRIFMETATILVIFVSSLLVGVTAYSIYTAFGPASKNLRDPFEEHED